MIPEKRRRPREMARFSSPKWLFRNTASRFSGFSGPLAVTEEERRPGGRRFRRQLESKSSSPAAIRSSRSASCGRCARSQVMAEAASTVHSKPTGSFANN